MTPLNLEEKVVFYYIIGTYGLYFVGAHYIFSPAMAWLLTLYLGNKLWNQAENTPSEEKITIPPVVWMWVISMLVMELALIVGHLDFNLGTKQIISSSINWARQWALIALFPLIGCLNIRPQLLYRATCILCLQSLIFIAIACLANMLHIQPNLYTSPLSYLGGNNENYYNVRLYEIDLISGATRLSLFAPWPPALGLLGNIYFFLAYQESDRKWRLIGMIGAIAMVVVSVSRLAILCLPSVPFLTWFLVNFTRPGTQITVGIATFLAGILATPLINFLETFREQFRSVRASSSEVRETLGRIALYRWWNDAPIWGHGITETRGPAVSKLMPIGSHHTWFGILFRQGLVGSIAFAFPLLLSFIDLLLKTQKSKTAKVGLNILLVLFLFTFAETIGSLAYILWPGLVMMGIAFKEKMPDTHS